MAENIYLPRLGQTMKEGTLVKWLKEDGAQVSKGEGIYTLEYDKATIDVESPAEGVLRIKVGEGGTVAVGTVVGTVGGDAEAAAGRPGGADMRTKASPLARRLAAERGVDIGAVAAGRGGRVSEEDVLAYIASRGGGEKAEAAPAEGRVRISPLARKLAEENGIDPAGLTSGDGTGRISVEDVRRYMEQAESGAEAAAPAASTVKTAAAAEGCRKEPMSGIRRVIAQRMCESAFSAPTVTYCTDVDMSAVKEMREKLNGALAAENRKVSVNDLIIKGVAAALRESPEINVSLEGEDICYRSEVNIGMAVATDRGLLVPVIRGADGLGILEIAAQTRELAQKAREGRLGGEDMTGGSFTVSNLGMLEIDVFTPIINQPESAILGIGRVADKPVAADGKVVIRPMMVLSLTADHRVIDGAPAAAFLMKIKRIFECPYLMMR